MNRIGRGFTCGRFAHDGRLGRKLAVITATVVAAFAPASAAAHNAGHIVIDGRCLEVGSNKEGPIVGEGAPQHALGQLDLIYDPRSGVDLSDQYGARWAAIKGNTPILAGNCPA
jgi:hypothetical protein